VRAWQAKVRVLHDFIREKRLPVFRRARGLLEGIERAEGVPGTESLVEEEARRWREQLAELVVSGRAAREWKDLTAALIPLQERFREVYATLHQRRDEAVAQANAVGLLPFNWRVAGQSHWPSLGEPAQRGWASTLQLEGSRPIALAVGNRTAQGGWASTLQLEGSRPISLAVVG